MQPSQYAESIYAQADINVIPLVSGGIKTALPSKTATILRVNKSIIFCVDYDCKLKSIMKNNSNIMFADTNDPNSLSSAINLHLKKKNGEDKINKVSFPSCFSKKNVAKYIDILTK
jgi:hypothetical protein